MGSGKVYKAARAGVIAIVVCAVAKARGLVAQSPAEQVPHEVAQKVQVTPEREQRMLQDAQRLLDLAQQLKVSVDKSTKDQLSMDVIREAEQIEKLARQVKERTRQ